MNDLARQKLCDLVAEYSKTLEPGETIADWEPARIEALLKDLCHGDHKAERFVLMAAHRARIPCEMLSASDALPAQALIPMLARRLSESTALPVDRARWAVESWAVALGTVPAAEPSNLQTPPLPPPLPSPPSPANRVQPQPGSPPLPDRPPVAQPTGTKGDRPPPRPRSRNVLKGLLIGASAVLGVIATFWIISLSSETFDLQQQLAGARQRASEADGRAGAADARVTAAEEQAAAADRRARSLAVDLQSAQSKLDAARSGASDADQRVQQAEQKASQAEDRAASAERKAKEAEQTIASAADAKLAAQNYLRAKATAEFASVAVDYDVYKDGVKGMNIYPHFTIHGMKGIRGRVTVFFYAKGGAKVISPRASSEYQYSDGHATTQMDFSPADDDTAYNENSKNLTLFAPYWLFTSSGDYKFTVDVWSGKTGTGETDRTLASSAPSAAETGPQTFTVTFPSAQ